MARLNDDADTVFNSLPSGLQKLCPQGRLLRPSHNFEREWGAQKTFCAAHILRYRNMAQACSKYLQTHDTNFILYTCRNKIGRGSRFS